MHTQNRDPKFDSSRKKVVVTAIKMLLIYTDHYSRLGWFFSLCGFLTFPQPFPWWIPPLPSVPGLNIVSFRADLLDTGPHSGWISSRCPITWLLNCSFLGHAPTVMSYHSEWSFCGWWAHSQDLRLQQWVWSCPRCSPGAQHGAHNSRLASGQTCEQMSDWQALCQTVLHVVEAESLLLCWRLSLNLQNLSVLLSMTKGTFLDRIKLRILRWGDYMDCLGGSCIFPRIFVRGKEGDVRTESEWGEWHSHEPRMPWSLRNFKRHKLASPLEPPEGASSIHPLILSLKRFILDFWPLELQKEKWTCIILSH